MPGPLDGFRIVDVSQIVSAPLATMLLADQGADVIKVEPPGLGDPTRQPVNSRGGMTSLYANCNRGKRSVVVDLKQAEGRRVVLDLVASADVFVENWRPGAAQRLGLGVDELRALCPDLIYATVSGYGDSGPYVDRRVYDPIIQGLTGFVALQQNPEFPIRDLVRNIVADKATSYTLAQAITAALLARERGAGGQYIHVPMIDAALAFMWPDGMMKHTLLGDDVALPLSVSETFRVWETADGHLVYYTNTPEELAGLLRALGRSEWLEEPRFQGRARLLLENREELGRRIMAELAKRTTAELVERLDAEDVPVGPVLSLDEMLEDEQIRHNRMVFEHEHPAYGRYRQVRPAARFSGTPQSPSLPPALHGEHTDMVLDEIGYDASARQKLRDAGVIP